MKIRKTLISRMAALAFVASAGATVATSCTPGPMYCLVFSGEFAAVLAKTSGGDCLPPVTTLAFDHFLGLKDKSHPDPGNASIAVTVTRARKALDAAEKQRQALIDYATCPSKDPNVNTTVDPDPAFLKATFYSLGKFKEAFPDGEENCFGEQFGMATLATPAMPAIPACAEVKDAKPVEALAATSFQYAASDVKVQVSPAVQGLYATGKLQYTEGQCTATYTFKAINPVVKCKTDAECSDMGNHEKTAGQLNEVFREKGVRCHITEPNADPTKIKGICVLK